MAGRIDRALEAGLSAAGTRVRKTMNRIRPSIFHKEDAFFDCSG
ncbi:hypothetical protein ACP26L_30675 [Paenibacillus sp. S-38]